MNVSCLPPCKGDSFSFHLYIIDGIICEVLYDRHRKTENEILPIEGNRGCAKDCNSTRRVSRQVLTLESENLNSVPYY